MIKLRMRILLFVVLAVSLTWFVSCSRDGDDAEQTESVSLTETSVTEETTTAMTDVTQTVSEEEEIERICQVIDKLKTQFDIPVSVDTYKSGVAKVGIQVGADMINDIWGLLYDKDMAKVIAASDTVCCLMHNRKEAVYENFFEDVKKDLKRVLKIAEQAGIKKEKIILDPGVGFGKTYEQNLEVIQRIQELKKLGYPVLLGASRKSVIGMTLDLPVKERLNGTLAITAYGVLKGCSFIRVHDIKQNKEVIKMLEAILKI